MRSFGRRQFLYGIGSFSAVAGLSSIIRLPSKNPASYETLRRDLSIGELSPLTRRDWRWDRRFRLRSFIKADPSLYARSMRHLSSWNVWSG